MSLIFRKKDSSGISLFHAEPDVMQNTIQWIKDCLTFRPSVLLCLCWSVSFYLLIWINPSLLLRVDRTAVIHAVLVMCGTAQQSWKKYGAMMNLRPLHRASIALRMMGAVSKAPRSIRMVLWCFRMQNNFSDNLSQFFRSIWRFALLQETLTQGNRPVQFKSWIEMGKTSQ